MKLSSAAWLVALSAAAALLVSACGGGSGSPAPAPAGVAVIPWVDVPSTPQSLTGSTRAARACAAADLEIVAGRAGAFHGQATQELSVRDRAADACFLAGVPQAQLPNAGARSQVSSDAFAAQRVDLAPGESATILIGTPAVCAGAGQPVVASSVVLTLPNGNPVTVSGTRVDTECGPAAVIAFEPADPAAAAPAPGPLSTLDISLSAPRTVARGAVLTYRVTMGNQSGTPVALSPCPSYTEVLGAGGTAPVQQTLLLNCAAAGSIAGNAALTYEMKLAVPTSTPTGTTKVSWKLEVPGGPVVGTAISVA
jgi:hypothetical protein